MLFCSLNFCIFNSSPLAFCFPQKPLIYEYYLLYILLLSFGQAPKVDKVEVIEYEVVETSGRSLQYGVEVTMAAFFENINEKYVLKKEANLIALQDDQGNDLIKKSDLWRAKNPNFGSSKPICGFSLGCDGLNRDFLD